MRRSHSSGVVGLVYRFNARTEEMYAGGRVSTITRAKTRRGGVTTPHATGGLDNPAFS